MPEPFILTETLPTDLSAVNPFVEKIAQNLQPLAVNSDDIFKIKLALEEALTNAMRHGNALDSSRYVCVRIEANSRAATIDIHDQGGGFDFQNVPDPTTSVRPSGRGVYLMRQIMDEVEFYDQGSGIKMKKKFSSKP